MFKISVICAFALAVMHLSLVEAQQPPIMSATPVVVYMPVILENPDFFEFSDRQKKHIGQVAQKSSSRREALDQSIIDMRKELREEQEKYAPDAKLVRYLVKEIQTQEAQRLQVSVDCANDLRKVLNAKQWETLISLVK